MEPKPQEKRTWSQYDISAYAGQVVATARGAVTRASNRGADLETMRKLNTRREQAKEYRMWLFRNIFKIEDMGPVSKNELRAMFDNEQQVPGK